MMPAGVDETNASETIALQGGHASDARVAGVNGDTP